MNEQATVDVLSRWYNRNIILYEMYFSSLINRELMTLVPKHLRGDPDVKKYYCSGGTRCLQATSPQNILYALEKQVKYDFLQIPINLYYSLSRYENGLPKLPPILTMRKPETDHWKKTHHLEMISYDCLIDLDSPNREWMSFCKDSATAVINFLDKYKMQYYLRFSGMGYHVIIPYRCFAHLPVNFDPDDFKNSVYSLHNAITKWLHDNITELVDTDLHDSRRVTKIPYSLAVYHDGIYVCWPFKTRQEFDHKTWKDYRVDHTLSFQGEQRIYKRGQKLFNEYEWTLESTDNMLRHMGLLR